jgi:hypothetical protein
MEGVRMLFEHCALAALHRASINQIMVTTLQANPSFLRPGQKITSKEKQSGAVSLGKINQESIPPSLWLVMEEGEGVYLMSNGVPGMPEDVGRVYPTDDISTDLSENIWEEIPLELIAQKVEDPSVQSLCISVTESEIEVIDIDE